jgi:cell division protein FtsZ
MEFDLKKDYPSIIKVIGVGGGGSNAVNHMFRQGIKGVDFVICNTDAQALEISPVPIKVQLGHSLTEGRGAGSMPEIGKNSAIENIEDIKKILSDNTKMVFITAGMGGGTGTGAAPIIAQAARDMGILTVGIVTVPFQFEGKKREEQARAGIEQLKNNVDTLIIICNERLREMYGNLKLGVAFSHADNVLSTAAKGIAEIITLTGYINVDFEDVKTAVKDSGKAIMGSAVSEGSDRAVKAIKNALSSPLLNDSNIVGARYILLNITSGDNEVTMDEIGEITDYVQEQAGRTADIIWGNCVDETLGDKLSVTLIATGFKTREEQTQEEVKLKKKVHTLDGPVPTAYEKPAEAPKNELSEPTLLKQEMPENESLPVAKEEPRLSFEFDMAVNKTESDVTLNQIKNEEPVVEKNRNEMRTEVVTQVKELEDPVEQMRKSRERIEKLKRLSYQIGGPNSVADMEREPAYKRRNVNLDTVPHSSEPNISRYTLSNEEDKRAELRQNNSFLHDNVD